MTEDQYGQMWNALHLGKVTNSQLYDVTSHVVDAKERWRYVDDTLTKAMKTLGQIGQKETTE